MHVVTKWGPAQSAYEGRFWARLQQQLSVHDRVIDLGINHAAACFWKQDMLDIVDLGGHTERQASIPRNKVALTLCGTMGQSQGLTSPLHSPTMLGLFQTEGTKPQPRKKLLSATQGEQISAVRKDRFPKAATPQ